jgi:hypothetical protein
MNFHSEQETLSALIHKISDGYCIITFGESLVDELLNSIEDDLRIKDDDILSWWLYEDVDKIIYDADKEISVRTLEELYNYIISDKSGFTIFCNKCGSYDIRNEYGGEFEIHTYYSVCNNCGQREL